MKYYDEIKQELISNEINKKVKDYTKNKYELEKYYNVGKILSKAGKHYGESIINDYSKRLTLEIGKGYGVSNLKIMRQFYYIVKKRCCCATPIELVTYFSYITYRRYK